MWDSKRPLVVIAAVSENNVIGYQGKLPWHLSDDLKRFKALTIGHPTIMGRKTWESLGSKPLPKRPAIVVTRQESLPGATTVRSVKEALTLEYSEVPVVIGGAAIYEAALEVATVFHRTVVKGHYEGDVFFPAWDTTNWQLVDTEEHGTHRNERWERKIFRNS